MNPFADLLADAGESVLAERARSSPEEGARLCRVLGLTPYRLQEQPVMDMSVIRQIINNPEVPALIAYLKSAILGDPTFLQRMSLANNCDRTLSPQTIAALYGGPRSRYVPAVGTAPSAVIAALAASATSTALTVSDDNIPRAFKFTFVQLDAGTSYNDIVMNVLVGGELRYVFSGPQLNPTTNNGCIASACQFWICAGALEDITVTFTNVSSAALGGAASVRVQGEVTFPGESHFRDCWLDCRTDQLQACPTSSPVPPVPMISGGGSCACKVG